MCRNRAGGSSKLPTGVTVCRWTLDLWQEVQACAQERQSFSQQLTQQSSYLGNGTIPYWLDDHSYGINKTYPGYEILTTIHVGVSHKCLKEISSRKKNWSQVPDGRLTPGQTGRLNVDRKLTHSLTSYLTEIT
jgi:hypothetical protein